MMSATVGGWHRGKQQVAEVAAASDVASRARDSQHMSSSLTSLSPELIEEISLYLRARDISSLALSCRRFHDIVIGSVLLQYAYRTDLAGVYDPLRDLSRCSIVDRMESLRRWEASWNDLGRYLSVSAPPRLVIPAERDLFGPFFLHDDYLFAVDWQGHPTGAGQPALLYVDLRDALRAGKHSWRKIDYPKGSIAITQAFSIKEDDLVVSVLSLPPVNSTATKTVLRFMSLETGGAHPLAREPDIQLDTELSVSLLDVRADVIGDQIVLVLVDLRIHNPESDTIYLVDWKRGSMTLVHRAPNGTYEGALAVLSEDLVLFLKRDTRLELCRVTTSPRGTGNINGDDAPPASLRVVRTLALPIFHPDYRVHTAYMQTDGYCQRQRNPDVLQQERQRPPRAQSPLTFHSAPEDMVVGITFLLRLRGLHAGWKKVVTTISHRALFVLADTGRTTSRYDEEDGDEEQGQEQEGGVGVGEVAEAEVVPWEEWGPRAARVISPPTFHWITAHAGQRWLSLEHDKLVIRDFSTARVLRARAGATAHTNGYGYNNENGAAENGTTPAAPVPVPVLAPAQTRIHGHRRSQVQDRSPSASATTCFGKDVVTELPFIETRVDVHGRAGDMVLTDGERLISFVRMGQPPTFDIYVLGDVRKEQEQQEAQQMEAAEEEGSGVSSLTGSVHPAINLNLDTEFLSTDRFGIVTPNPVSRYQS